MIHLWFISKYLQWYNDGITRWLMRDLTCVQSSRVCHSVKPEAEPVSSLPQPCPQAGSPKRLLKSSREAKAALFSHATCPLPGPGRCDAYGRGTVTCSPRFVVAISLLQQKIAMATSLLLKPSHFLFILKHKCKLWLLQTLTYSSH